MLAARLGKYPASPILRGSGGNESACVYSEMERFNIGLCT